MLPPPSAVPPRRRPARHRFTPWFVAAAALLPVGCGGDGDGAPDEEPGLEAWVRDLPEPTARDWAAIDGGDTLRALLVSNSTSYFVYRGEAMGFEFRALRAFAEEHGMALRVTVVRDRTELFRRLNAGDGDVVAARLVPVDLFQGRVAFTEPLYETRPTVVQLAGSPEATGLPEAVEEDLARADSAIEVGETPDPDGGPGAARSEAGPELWPAVVRARLVRRPAQLAGDTVHLPRGSEYLQRIVELSDTISGEIELVELEAAASDEAAIEMIATGSYRYTVAPENVAELSEEYFANIEIRPAVGREHRVSWAVRRNAPALRDSLDRWIERNREGKLAELYQTYFVDREQYRERVESEYLTSATGRLSRYDSLIADHADSLGWDWRLLASQAFQESRFDPDARSWAGAQGILQLMPATAREVGVRDPLDPAQNVAGAVRYLKWLDERWTPWIADADRRLPFVLASYNAGTGHVEDARRLTEAMGDDDERWDDVSFWLLQMSKRRYHQHPVVRFGYVRGIEPVTYVSLILERYDHYLDFVSERPAAGADG